MCGSDVGVADQRDVIHVLQAHDAEYLAILLQTPELDTVRDLVTKLLGRQCRVP